jgi:predicted permease
VIGRTVRINGEPATVVAVMPERFAFPRLSTLWVADRMSATPQRDDDRAQQLVMRIADPAVLPAVRTALDAWHAQALAEEPAAFGDSRAWIEPMQTYYVEAQLRAVLGVMFAATVLVLLVACGNAANLMLARQLGRRQEMAVRHALGASRGRLLVGTLAHAFLLSLLAAVIALAVAHVLVGWTIAAFAAAGEEGPPQWMRFDLDLRLVLAALAAALITAVIAGLVPALKVSSGTAGSLREGGRGLAGGGFARMGGVLVMVEIALSAALLVGALMMVQNVRALEHFDLGVRTERMLTARIGLFESQYPDAAARVGLFERLVERLRAEPDVEDATVSSALPGLNGPNIGMLPEVAPTTDSAQSIGYATIDMRFGAAYGTRLLAGRWFDGRDGADAAPVAIVDRKFVERHAGGRDPLGQRFRLAPGTPQSRVVTVVGVVEPLTIEDADDTPEPVLLVPQAQDAPSFASLALRLRGDPAAFKPRLAEIMREIDADTPLYWVRTYDEVLGVANFGQRLLSGIYGAFGAVALLLAAGGLYGVVAFTVLQRTREIGVRRALGASPSGVLAAILRRSAWQCGIGLGAGLALAVPFALALSHSMNGTIALDPLYWLLVGLVLATSAGIASVLPARRALRVDPMVALRNE